MRLFKYCHFQLRPQLFLYAFLALISTACAAIEPGPEQATLVITPTPTTEQTQMQEVDSTWAERVREVLMNAVSLTGIRYKYGGNTPETGFDCSGFVSYVYKQTINLTLPHNAQAISQIGKAIPRQQLQAGDLVFFKTIKNAISHVGIYMGENRFIHAPNSRGQVRIESMDEGYWAKRFSSAQRLDNVAKNVQLTP
ncbi:MAG: C40 family peptidase [Methylophilaceae bacterium]